MSRKSKKFSSIPDVSYVKSVIILEQAGEAGGTRVGGSGKKLTGIWTLRLPRGDSKSFLPVRFVLSIGAKVEKAITFVSKITTSRKVSSATSVRSRSLSDSIDSHRAEAVEDCIEFLHASSTRQRPN